jgi:hypothetical protein
MTPDKQKVIYRQSYSLALVPLKLRVVNNTCQYNAELLASIDSPVPILSSTEGTNLLN